MGCPATDKDNLLTAIFVGNPYSGLRAEGVRPSIEELNFSLGPGAYGDALPAAEDIWQWNPATNDDNDLLHSGFGAGLLNGEPAFEPEAYSVGGSLPVTDEELEFFFRKAEAVPAAPSPVDLTSEDDDVVFLYSRKSAPTRRRKARRRSPAAGVSLRVAHVVYNSQKFVWARRKGAWSGGQQRQPKESMEKTACQSQLAVRLNGDGFLVYLDYDEEAGMFVGDDRLNERVFKVPKELGVRLVTNPDEPVQLDGSSIS